VFFFPIPPLVAAGGVGGGCLGLLLFPVAGHVKDAAVPIGVQVQGEGGSLQRWVLR
jgi:hypothetical protein